jgi:hypothetical protein
MKRIDRIRMGKKADNENESGQVKKAIAIAKRLPGPLSKVAQHGGGAIEAAMKRRKVTQANISIFSTGFSIWFGIQLWIALISLGFLGLAYSINAIDAQINSTAVALVGETVTYYLGQAYEYTVGAALSAADWLFEQIFGFSLAAIGDPTNWFVATYFLTVLLGWATLLIAVVIYPVYMVNPFMGEGWKWKMGGFLISAFGYLIPGLNILPWFALYTACVWKNPE